MVAAMWGGFIYEGLLTPDNRVEALLAAWGQGCIELVITACMALPELWKQISHTWNNSEADFPGVFEYEVVAPLGNFMGNYVLAHLGQMPSPDLVKQRISELIHDFFSAQPPSV